jgi:hypothetical protein
MPLCKVEEVVIDVVYFSRHRLPNASESLAKLGVFDGQTLHRAGWILPKQLAHSLLSSLKAILCFRDQCHCKFAMIQKEEES